MSACREKISHFRFERSIRLMPLMNSFSKNKTKNAIRMTGRAVTIYATSIRICNTILNSTQTCL